MSRLNWFTALTDTKTTNVEDPSLQRPIRWERGDTALGSAYLWVKNASGGSLTAGDVVFFGTNDLTRMEVYKLGQGAKGTNANLMAGVVVASTVASGSYCWIQIFGYNATINTNGNASSAEGDVMDGVSGQLYCTRGVAAGTAPTIVRYIVALEAWTTVSAATKKGFIHCMH